MKSNRKKQLALSTLTPANLDEHPVWEFRFRGSDSEPKVAPLTAVPVTKLAGRLFATRFLLANGRVVPGFVASLDEANGALNRHLATLSFFDKGRWFHLARYHDVDYDDRGPDALAAFLGSPPDEMFPMSFDIAGLIRGDHLEGSWTIERSPDARLTRKEIIEMVVRAGAARLR